MLIKDFTTEYGITVNNWIITQAVHTRKNGVIDLKIIAECFLDRDSFIAGKQSFGRYALHVEVEDTNSTLEQMYGYLKEPILKEVVQEKVEGEEITPIYEDINYFKDAVDSIIV